MDGSRLQALDREDARAYADLLLTEATALSTIRRQVFFQKNEIQVFEITGQYKQIVACPITEGSRQRACVGDRDALKLEKINLKQTLLIGDQLYLFYRSNRALRSNPEIPWRLARTCLCVVPEPRKKRGDRVSAAKTLNVLPWKVDVESVYR